jgi:CBS domain containing-hemolysin-like protein
LKYLISKKSLSLFSIISQIKNNFYSLIVLVVVAISVLMILVAIFTLGWDSSAPGFSHPVLYFAFSIVLFLFGAFGVHAPSTLGGARHEDPFFVCPKKNLFFLGWGRGDR